MIHNSVQSSPFIFTFEECLVSRSVLCSRSVMFNVLMSWRRNRIRLKFSRSTFKTPQSPLCESFLWPCLLNFCTFVCRVLLCDGNRIWILERVYVHTQIAKCITNRIERFFLNNFVKFEHDQTGNTGCGSKNRGKNLSSDHFGLVSGTVLDVVVCGTNSVRLDKSM